MFGYSDLRRRILALEQAEEKRRIKEDCAAGNHKWVMRNADSKDDPYVRCEHCYVSPPKKVS